MRQHPGGGFLYGDGIVLEPIPQLPPKRVQDDLATGERMHRAGAAFLKPRADFVGGGEGALSVEVIGDDMEMVHYLDFDIG